MTVTSRLWTQVPQRRDEADFNNLLAVLQREVPSRPTLFEFYLDHRLVSRVATGPKPSDYASWIRRDIAAFHQLGYDYATVQVPGFNFEDQVVRQSAESVSLNEGGVISNRQDFDAFAWPDPDAADYDVLEQAAEALPHGMKLIPFSPGGVFENVTSLVGYELLCYLLMDEPQLVEDIFAQVGVRLLRYFERVVGYESVGACIANDDWGFRTNTLFSPADLRRLVFPWHKRIVEVVRAAGKPVILHSCGYFEKIIEDVIEDMRYDGRYSYEDNIMPVEVAYERYHERIAILGGIDVDFICQSQPQDVYRRSKAMLERVAERGGYALGTGTSVPDYMPDANFFALVYVVLDLR
jgi:uroporphyrinogen decarboxylase